MPITVASTLKRVGLSVMLKSETTLREAVGPTEFAIGRQSALDDLNRDIDVAIRKVTEDFGEATVFQLDCSCALGRTSRQASLHTTAEKPPHLLVPIGQWLRAPTLHLLRAEEGRPNRTHDCGRPPTRRPISTMGLPNGHG